MKAQKETKKATRNKKEEEPAALEELADIVGQLLEEGRDPEEIVDFIDYLCEHGKVYPKDAEKVVQALARAVNKAEEGMDNEVIYA